MSVVKPSLPQRAIPQAVELLAAHPELEEIDTVASALAAAVRWSA